MSETRTIKVVGPREIFRVNADSLPGAKQTRRRPKVLAGGELPRTFTKLGGGEGGAAVAVAVPAVATGAAPTTSPIETKQISVTSDTSVPASKPSNGGKVILGGKKPKPTRVMLTKKNHGSAPLIASAGHASKRHRKVTLGLQHLKHRVNKSRRLNKITKQTPIEQIKKELLAAKIIKEDSKAPEAVLRQMYADAKIISTKSL